MAIECNHHSDVMLLSNYDINAINKTHWLSFIVRIYLDKF
jgi:hypothetical protein